MRPTLIATALVAIVTLSGCNQERIPYLGHWDGGFDVVSSSTPAMPNAQINLRGYLQLYRTGDKFLIELSNPVQVLDLGGKWRMVGSKRIELDFHDFKLTEPDLDKLKGMRRPFIDPEQLHEAYTKPLILTISTNGKSLDGLLMRVGPLLGKHGFRKGE